MNNINNSSNFYCYCGLFIEVTNNTPRITYACEYYGVPGVCPECGHTPRLPGRFIQEVEDLLNEERERARKEGRI